MLLIHCVLKLKLLEVSVQRGHLKLVNFAFLIFLCALLCYHFSAFTKINQQVMLSAVISCTLSCFSPCVDTV